MTETGLNGFPVAWHRDCLLHRPEGEVWLGVRDPGTEVPERASTLLDALRSAGADVIRANAHDDAAILAVHDAAFVDHLASVWDEWEAAGYPAHHGRDRVVPYLFPTPAFVAGMPVGTPSAVHARLGRFCYDTMTLIGPGTWQSARAAADCALTAAAVVASGVPAAYALCRPPGHHACPAAHGGSCYLNNAAIAAQALREAGAASVAVLDVDAHHGNGTQAIFYARGDVYVGSVHVDPRAGWFPHYMGFVNERGTGEGAGANRNLPLAPGSGDAEWLAAVQVLCDEVRDRGTDTVVVSLGVDAAASDPESPLQVSLDGYRRAGELIGNLGSVVVVQEGGYDLDAIGPLVVSALEGIGAA